MGGCTGGEGFGRYRGGGGRGALALDVEMALEPSLHGGDDAGHREVEQAGGGEDGEELKVLADDLLRAECQFVDENHRGHGGPLDQRDRLVGEAWQDRSHRLRQDDPPQGQPGRHPQGRRRDTLATIDREDAAADDLGRESRLVQREAERRGDEAVQAQPGRRQRVEQEDELQDQRRAAEEPDVAPGHAADRRERRQAHQGEQQAQRRPAHQCDEGDLDGGQRAIEQEAREGVAERLADRPSDVGQVQQCYWVSTSGVVTRA